MSISSSLNAGVSGLNVNATRLATISDNIANSNTYGYRRAVADFSSVVLTGNQGAYTAGGVRASTFRQVEAHGSLISTQNSTDISIGGRGMLPVTDIAALDNGDVNYPLSLVTTGSFHSDSNGYLRTSSGKVLMGWPADTDGNIPVQPRDSVAGLEPVVVNRNQYAASPTTEMSLGANLPAAATQAGQSGTPLDMSIEYFDNTGASHTLTSTFTPVIPGSGQSNTWNMEVTDSALGGAVIGEFTIVFDDTTGTGGSVLSVTPTGAGTYNATTGAVTVTADRGDIDLTIGVPGSSDFLTQLSAEFSPISVTKNGAPVGSLTGVEIDENGYLVASYNTGFTRVIYQVPIADVPNPNGLTALDNQAFAISSASGPMYLWNAGDGPTGATLGYSLEESTTDIASELTQLIQTQRAYSSNAKIIQTVDEMLQETTNIKR